MTMQFGVCVASNITDVDYVVRAEELGYSHAWLADSQMLWSDCYATLALAATRTSQAFGSARVSRLPERGRRR